MQYRGVTFIVGGKKLLLKWNKVPAVLKALSPHWPCYKKMLKLLFVPLLQNESGLEMFPCLWVKYCAASRWNGYWLIFNPLFGYVAFSEGSVGAQWLAPLFWFITYFEIPLCHFVLCFSSRRNAKLQHLGGLESMKASLWETCGLDWTCGVGAGRLCSLDQSTSTSEGQTLCRSLRR